VLLELKLGFRRKFSTTMHMRVGDSGSVAAEKKDAVMAAEQWSQREKGTQCALCSSLTECTSLCVRRQVAFARTPVLHSFSFAFPAA
jgi:hypothetical protein